MAQKRSGQCVEGMRAGQRIQKEGGDKRVKGNVGYINTDLAKDHCIVLEVLTDFGNQRVFEKGLELGYNLRQR